VRQVDFCIEICSANLGGTGIAQGEMWIELGEEAARLVSPAAAAASWRSKAGKTAAAALFKSIWEIKFKCPLNAALNLNSKSDEIVRIK
jgi:hypothetical protein